MAHNGSPNLQAYVPREAHLRRNQLMRQGASHTSQGVMGRES